MRRIPLVSSLVTAALWLLIASTAHATTILYKSVEELTQLSDVVVMGEVVDSETYIGNYDRISTRWTIVVNQTLKGEHNDTITVTQFGGTLDGETLVVPGDAHFELGEQVVVFLHGDAPDLYLVSMGQAKITIRPQVQTDDFHGPWPLILPGPQSLIDAADMTIRELEAIGVYREGSVDHVPNEWMTLDDLVARIQTAAEGN